MKRRSISVVVTGMMILLLVTSYFLVNNQQAHAALQGDLGAHDPALIREGNTYYVFSTGGGIQIRTSTDMVHWSYAGNVFNSIPSWVSQTVGSQVNDLWAPDISYANGVYYLYYAGSVFGKNTSVIGLATNTTLDPHSSSYRWVDQGLVLHSTTSDNYNAIDPNLTLDAQGNPWLAFGSFWSGLKLRRLDPQTFKLSSSDTTTYALAGNGNGGPIEAPFVVYRNGYYYLFASIDFCCRGADSTYKTVVGRATSITGPYYNQNGNRMGVNGDFTILLQSSGNVRGPGGESVYRDGDTYRLIYHYYDANQNGAVKFNIVDLSWNGNWPQIGQSTPPPTPTPTRAATPTPTPTQGNNPTPTPTQGNNNGGGCRVSYSVNQWPGGFTANMTVTTSTALNGWRLEFTFPGSQQVQQGWNGQFSQSGNRVTVTNMSWNGNVSANGSINPGFNGSWNGSNPAPTSFTLNGIACSVA